MNEYALNEAALNESSQGQSSGFFDGNCSINVSNYKWMTPTLLAAQQKNQQRPYFTCKILDDSVSPSLIVTPPGQPLGGSAATAPDGTIWAVGERVVGGINLSVWKLTDASNASQWATPWATLDTGIGNPTTNGYRPDLNSSISISEYVNGTYTVNIYVYYTSGSNLIIKQYVSDNGGASFLSLNTVNSISTTASGYSYLSAGKPYLNLAGQIVETVFYTVRGAYNDTIQYQQLTRPLNPGSGYTFGSAVPWSAKNADSSDWKLHSLDSYYFNKQFYIAFSGYHNVLESTNGNYSIYLTSVKNLTNSQATDLWEYPSEILSSLSSVSTNQNSFTLPKCSFDGTTVWLTYLAKTVSGVSTSVSTTTQYFISQSRDGKNFSYPTPAVSSSGTILQDTTSYGFILQSGFYYMIGNGQVWQYVANSVTADVSNDVISYTISEQAGQADSVSLTIANQKNQWYGGTSMNPGASAIAKDRKILLDLGYWNALGAAETTARNVFFIDSIQQNVSNNTNELILAGRDFRRQLKNINSNYTFNFNGVNLNNDIFDGTTISNWNQIAGSWEQNNSTFPNSFVTLANGRISYNANEEEMLILSQPDLARANSLFSVIGRSPNPTDPSGDSSSTNVYAFYQDGNNWLKIQFLATGSASYLTWNIQQNIAGTVTTLQSGLLAASSTVSLPVVVRKTNYSNFQFLVGVVSALYPYQSNLISTFNSATVLGTEVSLASLFSQDELSKGAVGFSVYNNVGNFAFAKYSQYSTSLSIEELLTSISSKSRVFNYKFGRTWEDYLFNTSQWSGAFTAQNRTISVGPSALVSKTDQQMSDGEIRFVARVIPTNPANNYGFDFVFRNASTSDANNCYIWNINKQAGYSGATEIANKFKISVSGSNDTIASSSVADYASPSATTTSSLNIDLTQWHEYRLAMFGGWMLGFIDGDLALAWNDNSANQTLLSGYLGFQPNANTAVQFKDLYARSFWSQTDSYSINPGDDIESSSDTLAGQVRGWVFSDLLGRYKAIVLNSSDASTYSYNGQIQQQNVDNSAVEYSNQVTVYGLGVSATATSNSSIGANTIVRSSVIVDYKILTYQDALTRATQELNHANIFNNQSTVTQVLNVGAEVLDAVTVTNTGANQSGVNSLLRTYNETISVGDGQNAPYTIQIETGNING